VTTDHEAAATDAAAPVDGSAADPSDAVPAGPPIIAPLMPPADSRLGRVSIGRWFGLGGLVLGVLLIVSLVQAGTAIYRQTQTRDVLTDRIMPAALLQPQLSGSIGQQDTAIRGYAATRDPAAYATYRQKVAEQARTSAAMRRLLTGVRGADRSLADIAAVDRAAADWRTRYADPLAAAVRENTARPSAAADEQGFARVRTANAALQRQQTAFYRTYVHRLNARVTTVYWSLAAAVLLTLLSAAGLAWLIRSAVLRPLSSLAANVREVARGDLARPLDLHGSAEFLELASIVDAMRQRLVEEWRFTSEARRQLDEQATELRRSNAELEQFAYVASHDLQEPLRKVASFCQMLERKYGDKLDDRGRQYIDFAVDGAKRMQVLINDLLTFSRVGRLERGDQTTDMRVCLDRALYNLAQLREDTGAEVTADELPELPGDQTQFTQLLQNLIGNAIKFHGDDPPRVHIGAHRDGDVWEFSCSDNGIGIDAKYADRIFLIFQRLHPQDVYTGTGIGLAMCKKIVEHHGGRIWLDTAASATPDHPGTTIRWTLPAGEQ
jgi:signal transduction histidine kinase